MSVPTGGDAKYKIPDKEQSLFELIQNNCEGYDPMLLFLIGYNYNKLEGNYKDQSFYKLAELIQDKINKKSMNSVEMERTYRELYKQNSLSEVLNLTWLKRHKKKFEEENEEESLMIKQPRIAQEEHKDENLDEGSAFDDDDDLDVRQMPSFLGQKPVNAESPFEKANSDTYQDLLKHQQKLQEEEKRKEEEENQRLIEQLLEEEKKNVREDDERRKELERKSLLEAQRIQEELEKEHQEKRKEEEEKNKPECKICFDVIEFDEIVVLG